MGITYKAIDVNLRCPVTLKVISERYLGDESARLRFLREARAAASVRHPNVASVFHLGRTGQNYFYAMEFVEGETLESLIRQSGQLALEIATQVAAGLGAVHKQKLVHRDIKPSNIMVSLEEGGAITAKIIDLGLAKPTPDTSTESAISISGTFAGTPEFASPEQFAGVGVDIRSDLYSLGATLWQMLTEQAPFRGTPVELMYRHLHGFKMSANSSTLAVRLCGSCHFDLVESSSRQIVPKPRAALLVRPVYPSKPPILTSFQRDR